MKPLSTGCKLESENSSQFLNSHLQPQPRREDEEAAVARLITSREWRRALVWQRILPLAIGHHCPLATRWWAVARKRRGIMSKEIGPARAVPRWISNSSSAIIVQSWIFFNFHQVEQCSGIQDCFCELAPVSFSSHMCNLHRTRNFCWFSQISLPFSIKKLRFAMNSLESHL